MNSVVKKLLKVNSGRLQNEVFLKKNLHNKNGISLESPFPHWTDKLTTAQVLEDGQGYWDVPRQYQLHEDIQREMFEEYQSHQWNLLRTAIINSGIDDAESVAEIIRKRLDITIKNHQGE